MVSAYCSKALTHGAPKCADAADQSTTDLVMKSLVASDAGSSGGSEHLLRVYAIENSLYSGDLIVSSMLRPDIQSRRQPQPNTPLFNFPSPTNDTAETVAMARQCRNIMLNSAPLTRCLYEGSRTTK